MLPILSGKSAQRSMQVDAILLVVMTKVETFEYTIRSSLIMLSITYLIRCLHCTIPIHAESIFIPKRTFSPQVDLEKWASLLSPCHPFYFVYHLPCNTGRIWTERELGSCQMHRVEAPPHCESRNTYLQFDPMAIALALVGRVGGRSLWSPSCSSVKALTLQ